MQIELFILTHKDSNLNAVAVRKLVIAEYKLASEIKTFAEWLECKWCKYDGIPDWKDWDSLERSLLLLYQEYGNPNK